MRAGGGTCTCTRTTRGPTSISTATRTERRTSICTRGGTRAARSGSASCTGSRGARRSWCCSSPRRPAGRRSSDRKSTRLNSSHLVISYAVFCLKKKKHTSELQSPCNLVCRLLLEKKKKNQTARTTIANQRMNQTRTNQHQQRTLSLNRQEYHA